jgi:hypothetical protein
MVFEPIEYRTRRWDIPLNAALQDLQDQITTNAPLDGPGVYVPRGWGANWKAARTSGTAVLAALGGSSTQGYYASNLRQTGWVDLLRNTLQTAHGDGGSGYRSSTLSSLYQTSLGVDAAAITHTPPCSTAPPSPAPGASAGMPTGRDWATSSHPPSVTRGRCQSGVPRSISTWWPGAPTITPPTAIRSTAALS